MIEDELVDRVKHRAFDPARRTSMAWTFPGMRRSKWDLSKLPQPAILDAVNDAESRLGFRLPPLLGRLWVEVANGGFGPGYGLFGLEGGHLAHPYRLPLPDLYLDWVEDEGWGVTIAGGWPEKLVPVCDWGCLNMSAIDCSTSDDEIVDLIESDGQLRRNGITFSQWMENWVNGVALWRPGHV